MTIDVDAEEALPVKDDDDFTGWKGIDALLGIVKDAPPDMAENHEYLCAWSASFPLT